MKKKSFVLGALIGAAVGSVATALTTPKRGKELRDDMKTEAEKFYGISLDKYNKLSKDAKERFNIEFEKIKVKYSETSDKYKEELDKLKNKYFSKENNQCDED